MNHFKRSLKCCAHPSSGHRRVTRRVVLDQLHRDHRREAEHDEGHLRKELRSL